MIKQPNLKSEQYLGMAVSKFLKEGYSEKEILLACKAYVRKYEQDKKVQKLFCIKGGAN